MFPDEIQSMTDRFQLHHCDKISARIFNDDVVVSIEGVTQTPVRCLLLRQSRLTDGMIEIELLERVDAIPLQTPRKFRLREGIPKCCKRLIILSKNKECCIELEDWDQLSSKSVEIPSALIRTTDRKKFSQVTVTENVSEVPGKSEPDPYSWEWFGLKLAEGAVSYTGGLIFAAVLNEIIGRGESVQDVIKRALQMFSQLVMDHFDQRTINGLSGEVSGFGNHFSDYLNTPNSSTARENLKDSSYDMEPLIGHLETYGRKSTSATMSACALRLAMLHEIATFDEPTARTHLASAISRYRVKNTRMSDEALEWHYSKYEVLWIGTNPPWAVFEYGELRKVFLTEEEAVEFRDSIKRTSPRAKEFQEKVISPLYELNWKWYWYLRFADPDIMSPLVLSDESPHRYLVRQKTGPSEITLSPEEPMDDWAITKLDWNVSWLPDIELYSIEWRPIDGEQLFLNMGARVGSPRLHRLKLSETINGANGAWAFELSPSGGWTIRNANWPRHYLVEKEGMIFAEPNTTASGIRPSNLDM